MIPDEGAKTMERQVVILDHPLIQHKLRFLRDENTGTKEFRNLVSEIAMLIVYEATRSLPLFDVKVKTPCGIANCKVISGRKLAFVPILRAVQACLTELLLLFPPQRSVISVFTEMKRI